MEGFGEFEITSPIALSVVAPEALRELRHTGSCGFELTEDLFDQAYPGHYHRRIKAVLVSIPTLAGPSTRIAWTLTLVRSSVRISTELLKVGDEYQRRMEADIAAPDPRFRDQLTPVSAASGGDAPQRFEGHGVIGRWLLRLSDNGDTGSKDTGAVSDVILRLCYTARDGGAAFREAAIARLSGGGSLTD